MFSLSFDRLFPTYESIRTLVRLVAPRRRNQITHIDPRELHRIRQELRAARERLDLQSAWHRNRIF